MAQQKQHKQLILADDKNISTYISNQYNTYYLILRLMA